jgi:hypothetical protein
MSQIYKNSAGGGGSNPSIKITNFSTNGTFSIDAKTQMLDVYAWGGGAGGGGGQVGTLLSGSISGLGATPGYFVYQRFFAANFPASSSIMIGTGGSGGAGAVIGGGDGSDGSAGGNTTVELSSGSLTAFGGGGGGGGSASQNIFSSSSNSFPLAFGITTSANFLPPDISEGTIGADNNVYGIGIASPGGAGGGIMTSLAAAQNGGDIFLGTVPGNQGTRTVILSGGLAGVSDASPGSNGNDASSVSYIIGGSGGGGGMGSLLTNGANGGNGAIPGAGGGGGGGGVTGTGAGGNGGSGGKGAVIIIEYF